MGTVGPQRKCTCGSGLTVRRDQACNRAKEREQRERTWQDPCRDDLCDLIDPVEFAVEPPAKLAHASHLIGDPDIAVYHRHLEKDGVSPDEWKAFVASLTPRGTFVRKLEAYTGVKDAPSDVTKLLSNLLTSNDFEQFKQNHAGSLDMQLRWSFCSVCSDGSVEAASIFVNAGLKVTDFSTQYDCEEFYDDDDGHLDGVSEPIPRAAPCAATVPCSSRWQYLHAVLAAGDGSRSERSRQRWYYTFL